MTDKKRLKNVRRNFLHRAPDENQDLPADLPPDSPDIHLKENIAENLCFVTDKHQNFKVDYFQSLVESSKDPLVADFSPTNELSLQLGLFPNNPILSPEHLEIESQITPNSDIAAWAHKIIKIYKDYPKKMVQYRQLVQSDNINANASLRKMKLRATLACKKIETSYPHRKMLFLLKKESMTFLSSSSKEGFLKDLSYTFQSWGSWKRDGGASLILEDDSSVNSSTSYRFLDLALMNMEAVQQGPEYNVYVTDEKGSSEEKMIAQDIHVFEPVAEGVFVSIYFILKERTLLNDHQKRLSELDITEDEPVRVVTNAEMQKRFDENQAG